MKILQVVNHMYPNIGGIEQVARDIEMALSSTEIEQKIICFNSDASDGETVCRKGETVCDYVDGIEVIRCGIFAKIASQPMSFLYPLQLNKVMNEFRPDIVIFHYPNPFESLFLMNYKKRDFKLIIYWHLDITKQKFLGKLFHIHNLNLIKRADKIVATSPDYIEGSPYLCRFKEKCIVIPNCINPNKISLSNEAVEISEKIKEKYAGKTICFGIGRHVPYKGYTYLIKTAKLLGDSFKICIGGSGPLTEELKAEATECENVEFLGRISDEELVGYLLACDIFCFPSITKNEAFGIALAEAMYYKKPAVTFTIKGSGVNYVSLDGVTGIECPNGNYVAYAEALKKLADDPKLREEYGENGHNRVVENFTFERFKENIELLIKSCDCSFYDKFFVTQTMD